MSTFKGTDISTYPNERMKTKVKERKLSLNEAAKAKEYFSLRDQFILGPTELYHAFQEQAEMIQIIDVRQPADYAKGHLPGAINLPQDQWNTVSGLKKDRLNVIYCYSLDCPLAAKAAIEFATKGYSVMELVGGFQGWQEYNYKTEKQVHH